MHLPLQGLRRGFIPRRSAAVNRRTATGVIAARTFAPYGSSFFVSHFSSSFALSSTSSSPPSSSTSRSSQHFSSSRSSSLSSSRPYRKILGSVLLDSLSTSYTPTAPISKSSHPYGMSSVPFLCLDEFCLRQFKGSSDTSSSSIRYDPNEFVAKCLEYVNAELAQGKEVLVDGYAPFCKHIFVPNFTDAKAASIELNSETQKLVKTSYISRTDGELPVLHRYVSAEDLPNLKSAKYLDLILYSRDQINEENKARGTTCEDTATWGIVSVKPQDQPFETPMQPITVMRNALGKEEGGSGVPLSKDAYLASVKFWSENIAIS